MISYVGFKFCPFCGGEMPKSNMMKFCPFCGEKFIKNDNEKLEINSNIVVQPKLLLKNIDLENENKHEIYITDKIHEVFSQQASGNEYCSFMLKYAVNTNQLVENLEKVLLRGAFAVRLAVDNMPSLIIYKAKRETVKSLVKLFTENQASISIIPGEFNDKLTIEELFPMFNQLSLKMQQGIRTVPINLWIGDSIGRVFSVIYRENKEGILVITDKNIYILYKNTNVAEYRWLVISYPLLSKIIREDNSLQFTYKEKKTEGIEFLNKLELLEAFRMIQTYNFC
jgi:antitoxin component of MazEF toxin-antitoxin module